MLAGEPAQAVCEVYREPAGDAYKSVRRYTPDGAIALLFAPEWAAPVLDALKV
jgi:hypothetical protein